MQAERLRDINPETLNERQLDNILWKRYLYPSIDAVTQKLHALCIVGTVSIFMPCTIL